MDKMLIRTTAAIAVIWARLVVGQNVNWAANGVSPGNNGNNNWNNNNNGNLGVNWAANGVVPGNNGNNGNNFDVVTVVGTTTTTTGTGSGCASNFVGWGTSADCRHFFQCVNGVVTGAVQDCPPGTLYDVNSSVCKAASQTTCVHHAVPNVGTVGGNVVYYADYSTRSCKTENRPTWVTELFNTVDACCKAAFNWVYNDCMSKTPVAATTTTTVVLGSPPPTSRPTGKPRAAPRTSGLPNRRSVTPFLVNLIDTVNSYHDPDDLYSVSAPRYPAPAPRYPASSPINSPIGMPIGTPVSYSNGYPTFSEPIRSPTAGYRTSPASQLIVPVIEDTSVSRDYPNNNFGSHIEMAVSSGGSNYDEFASLMKFDVSHIDFNREIDNVELKLYVIEGCKHGGKFSVLPDSSWDHDDVTWRSAPYYPGMWDGVGRWTGERFATLGRVNTGLWYGVDATLAVSKDAMNTRDDYLTIRIDPANRDRCLYAAMEDGPNSAPRLVVTYRDDGYDTMNFNTYPRYEEPIYSDPMLDARPYSNPNPMSRGRHPDVVSGNFMLKKATDDATIVANSPNNNYGDATNLIVAMDNDRRGMYDTLLRFDLRDMLDMTPSTAILALYAEETCESAGTFVTTEGSGEWSQDSITWATAPMYREDSERYRGGTMIGTFGAVQEKQWQGFDVRKAVVDAILAGKDAVTFKITSDVDMGDHHYCAFDSIESGRAPKMLIGF